LLLPQLEQCPPPHPEQLDPELVIDLPSVAAKKTDKARVVWSLWHDLHKIGLSASFMDRKVSNW
jgi:hypothetical protein